jgi:outer membrane cobalamin receptor
VQILIDGRYRPEFNGSHRGDALQALAAHGIDRIEVMTNPPAGFKREGSVGIINIITRRALGSRTASAQAGLGSHGRYNAGASLGAQLGKLALRGSAGARHDMRVRDITDQRTDCRNGPRHGSMGELRGSA